MKLLNSKFSFLGLFTLLLVSNICFAQEGMITINQDKNITALIEAKKEVVKYDDAAAKYRIQIYSGVRPTAESIQRDYNANFTEWKSSLEYEAPNFKIWVGGFQTRLEGESALKSIKSKFPTAFIFKPKR